MRLLFVITLILIALIALWPWPLFGQQVCGPGCTNCGPSSSFLDTSGWRASTPSRTGTMMTSESGQGFLMVPANTPGAIRKRGRSGSIYTVLPITTISTPRSMTPRPPGGIAAPTTQPWRASRPATTKPPGYGTSPAPTPQPQPAPTHKPHPCSADCDCRDGLVTQAQFQALVVQITNLEVTVGILVKATGPIPEDPLPGPGDNAPPLPGGTGPVTIPPPATVEGPSGPQGPQGPQGPPGSTPVIDYDKLIAKLPPREIHFLDGEGNVAKTVTVQAGEPIPIYAQRLHTMDKDDKHLQETTAPLGEPLGLRFKPVKAK